MGRVRGQASSGWPGTTTEEPLFSTIYGIIALVVAGILMVAGIVWLNKIVTIEV